MFSDNKWVERLGNRLQEPLPGLDIQLLMAPDYRQNTLKARDFRVPENAKQSAVLMLFFPGEHGYFMPLIERNAYEGVHSKQISLPGGQQEPTDESYIHTALREAEEEIGVKQDKVKVLGHLSPLYIPPSNFFVQPVVGIVDTRPDFVLDPGEVASLIETPLLPLVRGDFKGRNKVLTRGQEWEVPSYTINGHIVWGATAMMLSELTTILNELH